MADKGTRGDFTPQELPKHAAGAQACLHVLEIAKTFPGVSRFSQTRLSWVGIEAMRKQKCKFLTFPAVRYLLTVNPTLDVLMPAC